MPTLLMLRGLPASGKTTYTKVILSANPLSDPEWREWRRVNKDEIRERLFGPDYEWSRDIEKATIAEEDRLIVELLGLGFNVIVDDTNLTDHHEERCRRIAASMKAEFKIKDFNESIDECIARDALRDGRAKVGEKAIRALTAKRKKSDD